MMPELSEQSCSKCGNAIGTTGLLIGTDYNGKPNSRKTKNLAPFCASCLKAAAAIKRQDQDADEVRLAGYKVAIFPRLDWLGNCMRHTEMKVDIYRPGRSYGAWTFELSYKEFAVGIERRVPSSIDKHGNFKHQSVALSCSISGDDWLRDPVEAAAPLLGADIAEESAPMLEVPTRDELQLDLAEQWAWLLDVLKDMNSGKSQRDLVYLGFCWMDGALTFDEVKRYRDAWESGRSVEDGWPNSDGAEPGAKA